MSHNVILLPSSVRRLNAATLKWSLALAVLGLLALRAPAADTNAVSGATNAPAATAESPEAVEREYSQLLAADDEAQGEVDKWIRDNNAFTAQGAGVSAQVLNRRILERFAPIRKSYEEFLQRHPNHVKALIAFGSFLNDLHEEDAARDKWEKALKLDPKNPAIYNNLANIFTHDGPITNAIAYYEKAIQLNPLEPLYYHNLSDTVYSFRTDAKEYYSLTNDQQVFDKSLDFFRKALKLDPENFTYASEFATDYYGIKPLRVDEALGAWTNALQLAHDDIEREGVYLHLARVNLAGGRFALAHAHLDAITNAAYADLKGRLAKNLARLEAEAQGKAKP